MYGPNPDEHFRTPLEWEQIHGMRPRNRHHYLNAGFMEDSRVSEELWRQSIMTKTCYFDPTRFGNDRPS